MAQLDVFNSDAFGTIELTNSVNLQDHVPGFLGSLGIFTEKPVTTTTVMIEERGDKLALVPNTPRGGVPQPLDTKGGTTGTRRRKARSFSTLHLPKTDQIFADEIQNVRAFGAQSELEMIQQKVDERMAMMRRDIDLTLENLYLGAIKGTIVDADASTIYDLFDEFDVTQETEVDFDLDAATPASGAVRKVCNQVIRLITRNVKGAGVPGMRVFGICGDAFFDDLTAHSEVRATYLNTAEASQLRLGVAFGVLDYGGITFVNYRGTDDGSTVAVNTNKCHLFPVGVPGLFDVYYAPADSVDWANTPGQPYYALASIEPRFRKFVDLEVQSNPLPICTQPKALILAKRT